MVYRCYDHTGLACMELKAVRWRYVLGWTSSVSKSLKFSLFHVCHGMEQSQSSDSLTNCSPNPAGAGNICQSESVVRFPCMKPCQLYRVQMGTVTTVKGVGTEPDEWQRCWIGHRRLQWKLSHKCSRTESQRGKKRRPGIPYPFQIVLDYDT